jgi:hypothetical protein
MYKVRKVLKGYSGIHPNYKLVIQRESVKKMIRQTTDWKQLKCSPTNEYINQFCVSHNGIEFRNEVKY